MGTASNMDRRSNLKSANRGSNVDLEDQRELESLLQQQHNRQMFGRERDLDMHRSGSAPPTVEGLLRAMDSQFLNSDFRDISNISSSSNGVELLSDDELRWHPAYLSYYYSNEHANPRLPPPLLSREDWRVAQRFQNSASLFDPVRGWRQKAVDVEDNSSLFSVQPGIPVEQAENELMELRNAVAQSRSRKMAVEWLDRGAEGLGRLSDSTGLGPRRKSFADILQEGLDRDDSLSRQILRPASCNTFLDMKDPAVLSSLNAGGFNNTLKSHEALHSGATLNLVGIQNSRKAIPVSTMSPPATRNRTPETHLVGRSAVSALPPIGTRIGPIERKNAVGSNIQSSESYSVAEVAEAAAKFPMLNVSDTRCVRGYIQSQIDAELDIQSDSMLNVSNGHKKGPKDPLFSVNYDGSVSGYGKSFGASTMESCGQVNFPIRTSSSANLYSTEDPSMLGSPGLSSINSQNANTSGAQFTRHDAYFVNKNLNSFAENYLTEGSNLTGEGGRRGLNGCINQVASDFQSPVINMDPRYVQYLQRASAAAPNDQSLVTNSDITSHGEMCNEYLAMLLAQNRQQFGRFGAISPRFFESPPYDLGSVYPGNSMPVSSNTSRNFQNVRISHPGLMMKASVGGSHGSTCIDVSSTTKGRYPPSLLDEFKNNKTRPLELSNILGHVIEFSMDQYGSRFIQQKLETATEEEKNEIFPEIIPYARTLMTDVFGNYVIQKFFEHGTESQRKELVDQLTGYVLPLSLQMYGCRVIQKALEVVDVDQQVRTVRELDGAVMKCVHDQNGNHVIQKCIECVPLDRIQFIISAFYGQVVALATHPYGCRVIQRVLEHSNDTETQRIIMEEIMLSVCVLAQDQYGNYVIQHVIQHGKPHERSEIIGKLAGQIVKMSQQKFASNVVEKCLTFGGPEEHQILVNEMLGANDDNEPLQVMMKDPFGNYVVQKVLETCNDQNLELILSRIRVHLNTLKRYTYGKHIVSRVEKLITTGERRIGLSSSLAVTIPESSK